MVADMPLRWKRGENPYRVSYFGILEMGAHANPRQIRFRKTDLIRKISGGGEHRVADRAVSEADLTEAESRLFDPAVWASEALLVHPRPATDEGRLPDLCAAVDEATALDPLARPLPLSDLTTLAPLIPPLHEADLPRPSWADLPIPAPGSPEDHRADIQFDL
jgi:hypothetical protein